MSSDNSHTLSAHPQGYENIRGKERGRTHSVFFQGLIHIHCLFFLLWCLRDPLEGSGGRNERDGTRLTLGHICVTHLHVTRLLGSSSTPSPASKDLQSKLRCS